MCGKFTTRVSWTEVVDLVHAQPADAGDDDRTLILRVMSNVPMIVWDAARARRVPRLSASDFSSADSGASSVPPARPKCEAP